MDLRNFVTDPDPRIRTIDLRIRIRGSVPLTYGTESRSYFFRQWVTRCHQKISFFLSFSYKGPRRGSLFRVRVQLRKRSQRWNIKKRIKIGSFSFSFPNQLFSKPNVFQTKCVLNQMFSKPNEKERKADKYNVLPSNSLSLAMNHNYHIFLYIFLKKPSTCLV